MIAFDVHPDPTGEGAYMFDERHTCKTLYVGPCRGCAQARVQHDDGDEQPGEWSARRSTWLVGGGRYSIGVSGP